MQSMYLGVEIGCTKQQLAVCDGAGRIVESVGENVPHPNGAKDILDWLGAKAGALLERSVSRQQGVRLNRMNSRG